jgi:hypothetical protein
VLCSAAAAAPAIAISTGATAPTAATGSLPAAAPAEPRTARGVVAPAPVAASSTSNQNAVGQFETTFSDIGCPAASIAVGTETGLVAAFAAAVKTAGHFRSVAADIYY